MSAEEKRAAGTLALIFFLRMTGLFMITPVFAVYAGNLAGATATMVGLAIGIYGLTQALLQIPFGAASDRWGRKPVITLGLAIFIVGSIVAAVGEDIFIVMLGRALQGAGAVGSATMALAADLTRDEQRLKAMAIIGITIGLAFPVAFVIGPVVSGHFGAPAVFWLSALLGLLALAVLYLWVPQPKGLRFHRDCEYNPGQFWNIIRDPQLMRVDYGVFTLHAVMTATFVVTPVILQSSLNLPLAQHWHLYLPTLVLSVVALGPLFRISEGKGQMREMFLMCIGLLAVAQIGLGLLATHYWVMASMLVLFFTAVNFLEASLPSIVSRLAPAEARGTAMGIYSTSQFIGIFFGGAVGGWLNGYSGALSVYIFNAILTGLWLLPTLSMPKLRQVRNRVLRVGTLSGTEGDALTNRLRSVPGVLEAVVLGDEGCAYLKVDPTELDATALDALVGSTE